MVSFVFIPHPAGTDRIGIVQVKLGAGGSLGDRLIHELGSRPVLG
jgi:hypothetical protein